VPTTRRGDYGYDAPYALVIFGIVAAVSGVLATIAWWRGASQAARIATVYFVIFLGSTVSFFYTTRRGKFLEWDAILDRAGLRGDERVLDMGCGRGAVLTAVAKRLTTGRVTGVDIWSTHDQSGNAREIALRNASLEGVADRVIVETGDRRGRLEPRHPQHLVERPPAGHRGRLSRAEARRPNGDCGHPRDGDLRRCAANAGRVERGASSARLAVLVGQPRRGDDAAHRVEGA
jgi:SAM-dependent methyltransferase